MINPKSFIVGSGKAVKIRALTKMIPAAKVKQELKNFAAMFVPIIPPWMLEFEQDEKHYLVPRNQMDVLVSDEDVDDWNYLLERFNNLLANLTKLLNNVRKIDYHKIAYNKLLEREIENRRIKLTEKLLEKTEEKEEEEAKTKFAGPDIDQEDLGNFLTVLAAAAAGSFGAADPLDAATIKDAKASGADLVAAAHLATLEASGAQNAADAFQVMLNRAKKEPLSVVITKSEQFSPYSAAIYGTSGDANAVNLYGHLNVTKKEFFEIAAKPNGLELLVERFDGYGNAAIAQQILDDFKSEGPLSQASAEFVGGALYFRGTPTGDPTERKRGEGGNYFRDVYATGAIILPQLFDVKHNIYYNVNDKTDDLAQFIVDRPTVVDMQTVDEPLIVIPTERPIGQQILNILFKEPFKKVEMIFERNKKEQQSKAQTPIQNNTTSITRSPIPESSRPTSNYLRQRQQQQSSLYNNDMGVESITRDTPADSIQNSLMKINTKISDLTRRSQTTTRRSLSNIDTVSQKTDNVFGAKVILMTQDIYATEE